MRKLFKKLYSFIYETNAKNINLHAASCAFYMFLAFVPSLALLSSVLPYTRFSEAEVLELISPYIPEALKMLSADILSEIYSSSVGLIHISFFTALWLSSRSFYSLIRGIEIICESFKKSSFIRRNALALLYIGAVVASMLVLSALFVFGDKISKALSYSRLISFVLKLRLPIVFAVLTLIFIGIYRFVPRTEKKVYYLPGALFSSCAWLLFTWLFSLYIRFKGGYTMYGSLAGIVISLLWMYWCMYIILLGAQLNHRLDLKRPKTGA